MNRFADQAYLRTRLAILSTNVIGRARLRALAELPLEELEKASGLDQIAETGAATRLAAYERALMQTWLDELSALLRPLMGPARRLLMHWASRYELLNIKALVRGKIGRLPTETIERSLFRLPGFLGLNHEELLNTDNVPELLRQLQKTRYKRIATQALRRYEERPDPFLIDATLDQQFYGELSDRTRQLASTDREAIHKLVGRIVDRHNLVWSLRYRFNYGLQTSEVLYLAIDGGRELTRDTLHQVINTDSLADAIKRVPAILFGDHPPPREITLIESVLRAELLTHARGVIRRSPSVLTSILAYLVVRYEEISQLYAIAHARLHDMDPELLNEAFDPLQEDAA